MAFLLRAGALLAAAVPAAGVSGRSNTTPLAQVIDLITKLKTEVEQEGKDEAKSYDKFACFCKSKTMELSGSITGGSDTIDLKASDIEDKTAGRDEKSKELMDAKQEKERASKERGEGADRCSREKTEFEAQEVDTDRAISSLEKGIKALEQSKPAASASLLGLRQAPAKQQDVADALEVLEKGEALFQSGAVSLLQEKLHIDPNDPMYKFKSQGLIDLCNKVLIEFQSKKSELVSEIAKHDGACREKVEALDKQVSDATTLIRTTATKIDTLGSEIGAARRELLETQEALKDQQLFLKDLTGMCEERAKDWDQRSAMRKEELGQLQKALSLLQDKVAEADKVNERALLQAATTAAPSEPSDDDDDEPSFIQQKQQRRSGLRLLSSRGGRLAAGSPDADLAEDLAALKQSAAEQVPSPQEKRMHNTMAMLQREGRRLGSSSLAMLVLRTSSDPFKKVKGVIQKLMERLIEEATQEATKKGFCDTELAKAKQDRDYRMEEVNELMAELGSLKVKKEELDFSIKKAGSGADRLTADLSEAKDVRTEDHTANMETIKKAKEGYGAVSEALMIIKSFYSQAAKAFIQTHTHASLVDEATSDPGFDGAYSGKQTAAGGIVAVLEVIVSDFKRTITETTITEKEQHKEFTEFDRASQADLAGLQKRLKLDAEELDATKAKLDTADASLKENMDLVDLALKKLEKLRPMCIDTGMSAAQRKQKREDEVSALRAALCMLDSEGVEECS